MEQAGGNLALKGSTISAAPAPWQLSLSWLCFPFLCFKFIFIYFIWLCHVSATASGTFSCGMWDLVSWPRMEPGASALGAQSLSHWTIREVPLLFNRVAFLIGLTSWLFFYNKTLSAEEKDVFEVFRAYMTHVSRHRCLQESSRLDGGSPQVFCFAGLLAFCLRLILQPHSSSALWMTVSKHDLNLRHLSRSQS